LSLSSSDKAWNRCNKLKGGVMNAKDEDECTVPLRRLNMTSYIEVVEAQRYKKLAIPLFTQR
jgi:hypothetical protein